MKSKQKKAIAIILAVSLFVSPVKMMSFAEDVNNSLNNETNLSWDKENFAINVTKDLTKSINDIKEQQKIIQEKIVEGFKLNESNRKGSFLWRITSSIIRAAFGIMGTALSLPKKAFKGILGAVLSLPRKAYQGIMRAALLLPRKDWHWYFTPKEEFPMEDVVCRGMNNTLKCYTDKGFSKDEARSLVKIVNEREKQQKVEQATGIKEIKLNELNKPNDTKPSIWNSIFAGGSFAQIFLMSILMNKINQAYCSLKTKIQAGKVEKPIDPVATMKLLDMLMLSVKGQENAKKQIRSLVLNIVDKNAQFMANKNWKKAGPGASVIYMVGPSGVGKSFSAEIIRKVLSGFAAEPFVIEASDIDKQSKSSAVDQLFGMRIKRVSNSEYYEYAPLVQRLKSIPNTVVVINEYDKMHSPELDEKLRTIMDQGYINVNGEKIDCSAATFIITSNENSASVNKGNNESDTTDDGTGSRTFINHDKAFLNRIKLIEFDNLSAEEYKEIAIIPFSQLAQRYKIQYGIDLDFNGTIDEIAQKVAEINRGARPIFTYLELLNDKLLNEVVLRNLNTCSESVKYKVSFDKDKNTFILENINNCSDDKNKNKFSMEDSHDASDDKDKNAFISEDINDCSESTGKESGVKIQ